MLHCKFCPKLAAMPTIIYFPSTFLIFDQHKQYNFGKKLSNDYSCSFCLNKF